MFNYEQDIKINLDELELNCQEQGELVLKYAKEKVRLSKLLRDKKENLSIFKAQMMRPTIEKLTKENGGKKPTVGEIDADIILMSEYQDLSKQISDIEYEYDLVKEALFAMSHRKEMLQEERALISMGYFSKVSRTKGIRKEQLEAIDNQTREEVNKKRRARRNEE